MNIIASLFLQFITSRNLAVRIARTSLLIMVFFFLVLAGLERGLPLDPNWNWLRLMVAVGAVVVAASIEARNEDFWWWSRYVIWGIYASVAVPVIMWQWIAVLLRQAYMVVGG